MKLLSPALYERIGREAIIAVLCFLIAQALNVCAILIYKTDWSELYTQAGWLLILTGAFYLLSIVLRVGAWFVLRRRAQRQ